MDHDIGIMNVRGEILKEIMGESHLRGYPVDIDIWWKLYDGMNSLRILKWFVQYKWLRGIE